MRSISILALFVAHATPAFAEQGVPLTIGAPTQVGTMLRAGTDVLLKTTAELSTEGKHLRVGDRFQLEVSEAVKLDGRVVIPAGARATGEVTAIRNKGMWGKSGSIGARALYVIANDRQIRLSGTLNDKGSAGGVGAVAGSLIFLPAGFFVTGTSARIPAGTQLMSHLDEDVPVVFAGEAAAAPVTVPASSR